MSEELRMTGKAHAVSCKVDSDIAESLHKRFVAFDVETTGLSPMSDRIVEIGAVLFEDGKPVSSFSTLVNPQIPIPDSASAVNHITNDMLAAAPVEDEVYPGLTEFLGDALEGKTFVCAHNARFDMGFLCNTLSRLGFDAAIRYVDTLSLSRKYINGLTNYKQCTVEQYFGLTNTEAHRAASDAEICGKILCGLLVRIDSALAEQKKRR